MGTRAIYANVLIEKPLDTVGVKGFLFSGIFYITIINFNITRKLPDFIIKKSVKYNFSYTPRIWSFIYFDFPAYV